MSTVVWMCLTSSKTNIKNIEQKSLNSFLGQKVLVVMHVYCIVQIQIFNIQNNHVNRSSKLSRANCKRDMIQNQKVKASWCTPVVVRGEDELEIDPIRIGSLENLFRLYRIHHCSFFGALINDSAAVQNQIEVYWPIILGGGVDKMKWNNDSRAFRNPASCVQTVYKCVFMSNLVGIVKNSADLQVWIIVLKTRNVVDFNGF